MILVVGSTGTLGTEIVQRLANRGHAVRAMVRAGSDPARVRALELPGVERCIADLKDAASVASACAGVDTVVSTASATRSFREGDSIATVDGQGQLQLVDCARAAGVEHLILVSISGGLRTGDPLTLAKRAAEAWLMQSGIRFTVLRPSLFMETWLSPALGFDYSGARATVFGSGDAPNSYISLRDVAEYAVRSVKTGIGRDRVLDLGGPEALSQNDVIRIFERVSGRPFSLHNVPESSLRAQYQAAPDALARTLAALSLVYARGDVLAPDPARILYTLSLRTVEQYAREVAAVPAQPRNTSSA